MPLKPVLRQSVPDQVFEQIMGEVVHGTLGPGAHLPSERLLAEALGVSRPAVREALQRIAQAGLLEVRQGDITTVRDFRKHGGLDLLPRLLLREGELDLKVARSIFEARMHMGPRVAALAAERAGKELESKLHYAVLALTGTDDPIERQRRALAYWDYVVDGADSIAFRLMFNSLRAAYEPALEALATIMAAEVGRTKAYRALADAIVSGEPETAHAAAEDLLTPATFQFYTAIKELEKP